ncbi:hypothetical protein [Mycobacterium sp. MMS18-G62]
MRQTKRGRADRRNNNSANGDRNRDAANRKHDGTDRHVKHEHRCDEHGFDVGQYQRQHRLDIGQH